MPEVPNGFQGWNRAADNNQEILCATIVNESEVQWRIERSGLTLPKCRDRAWPLMYLSRALYAIDCVETYMSNRIWR